MCDFVFAADLPLEIGPALFKAKVYGRSNAALPLWSPAMIA